MDISEKERTMLPYFPGIYTGELLYSLLGRLRCHGGVLSPKHLLADAFSNRNVRAGIFLQPSVGLLEANTPPSLGLTAQKLVQETTLLPYLTAYQSEEIRNWALDVLSANNCDAGAVHVRLGLVASNVRLPSVLRYCLACRAEMLRNPGELYWRRDHQLPGVLVCPIHGTPLAGSKIKLSDVSLNEFIVANEENCPPDPALPRWADQPEVVKLLRDIAKAGAALLANPPAARPLAVWGDEIKLALRSRGLARGNASINQIALREAYLTRFHTILDALPYAAPGDWLEAIARKHRKAFAPLRHILIQLLIESLALTSASTPFGTGPWPCRNPLAEHFGQSVIADCKIHQEGGKTIGVFRCSCGYDFSAAPESNSRAKILNLGPKFETRLRELVSIGSSLRSAARELHVDPNTVLRYVALFGLEVPWKSRPVRSKLPPVDREEMRATWSAGHSADPNLTRQQLRHRLPAVYAWLYRNDRDWLHAQPPAAAGYIPCKPRLDWPSIDATTAQTLEREAARLRTLDRPQQITRLALECALGQRGWLEKRLHKLPWCVAVLSEETESVEEFQCRRAMWAAAELQKQYLPIQVWRLRRLAGLPDQSTARVESLLIELASESERSDRRSSAEFFKVQVRKPPNRVLATRGVAARSAKHVGPPTTRRKAAG
jgi:hypothetical protein